MWPKGGETAGKVRTLGNLQVGGGRQHLTGSLGLVRVSLEEQKEIRRRLTEKQECRKS